MKNTYAILISVDKYKSEDIPNLDFCLNDLRLVHKCMVSNLNIPTENILVLGNQADSNVTRAEILRAVGFTKKLSQDIDTLIFYFTGHGTSYNRNGYLVTYDTEIDLPADTSVSISRIIDEFKESNIKNKLLIIDSCFSGIDFSKGIKNIFEDMDNNIEKILSEGWTLMASCKGNELSYLFPEKNISVFTYFLAEAINVLPGINETNRITIEDLNDYVFKKVAKWAMENKKMQTPNLKTERVGSFALHIKGNDQPPELTISQSDFELNKYAKTIILSSSKYFSNTGSYRKSEMFHMGSTIYNPLISASGNDFVNYSYTDEERIEKLVKYKKDFLSKFFTNSFTIIKPSQIRETSPDVFLLPFCKLDASKVEDFTITINLYVDYEKIDDKVSEFLESIDNQSDYKWKSVKYSFDGSFDFDRLIDSLNSQGYKIYDFDFNDQIVTAKYDNVKESLIIRFQNKEDKAFIQIEKYSELPAEFFDILPIEKIITDFIDTIINAH